MGLLSELEKPVICPSDGSETLCLAQHYQVKTEAAIAGLKTLLRVDEQREGIISDLNQRIAIRGEIIEDLRKIDTNFQRVDVLGQNNLEIMREQHREDKDIIGDLQKDLASCRSNQKWIALGSAVGGGWIGYKIRGTGTFQNPFNPSNLTAPFLDFETTTEKNLRSALKNLQK